MREINVNQNDENNQPECPGEILGNEENKNKETLEWEEALKHWVNR